MKTYLQRRNFVTARVVEMTMNVYPGDREMMSGVMNLTSELKAAEPSDEFVNGLIGFYQWSTKRDVREGLILNTFIHDLGEFAKNRHEPWFSPRSERYQEFFEEEQISI